ncbi:lytic transglycosylase domain-containing protein [Streptomyces sp. AV19]|uniref:transglycosylase SLT domain-containing protein n=1 Tax=Streptomyces sp. AV19 TaxID=2793068 RepID=UPI0018FE8E5D|nr:transglycosylase SLT domain-containing protein [Streptomyces sp. AV19]MBH1934361.1 lytic transglycosylase domain-containing protein [Streptomyces sp. AV19]MDG4533330.1 lytic transglycosylase domain-containing protein [Streptomyces sp. AV19]
MRNQRRAATRLAAAAALAAVGLTACGSGGSGGGTDGGADRKAGRPAASGTASPGASATPADGSSRYDPARYAPQVDRYAREAGVSPRLVMAILYNEAYKPHDPEFERSWQKIKPDSAFGIANMHRAAYDETKRGRPFADRSWFDLPDDPALAVRAAAWYLHDLARQLPAQLPAQLPDGYTKDELLALGYNTGAGNMAAFARGARPGPQARTYLNTLRGNWDKAQAALKR